MPGPALVLEWIGGRSMRDVLHCKETSTETKQKIVSRLAEVCHRRHVLATDRRDPRFVMEHPTFAHILVDGERLVHIDFEMVFTRKRRIDALIDREIISFLRALSKLEPTLFATLFDSFINAYPQRSRLEQLVRDTQRRRLALVDGFSRSGTRAGLGKREIVERLERRLAE